MEHILGKDQYGRLTLLGELLVCHYDEGDCDTIDADAPNLDNLRRALYDARECDDRIGPGDTFALDGVIIEV